VPIPHYRCQCFQCARSDTNNADTPRYRDVTGPTRGRNRKRDGSEHSDRLRQDSATIGACSSQRSVQCRRASRSLVRVRVPVSSGRAVGYPLSCVFLFKHATPLLLRQSNGSRFHTYLASAVVGEGCDNEHWNALVLIRCARRCGPLIAPLLCHLCSSLGRWRRIPRLQRDSSPVPRRDSPQRP
jgi:hypothetical protein